MTYFRREPYEEFTQYSRDAAYVPTQEEVLDVTWRDVVAMGRSVVHGTAVVRPLGHFASVWRNPLPDKHLSPRCLRRKERT